MSLKHFSEKEDCPKPQESSQTQMIQAPPGHHDLVLQLEKPSLAFLNEIGHILLRHRDPLLCLQTEELLHPLSPHRGMRLTALLLPDEQTLSLQGTALLCNCTAYRL